MVLNSEELENPIRSNLEGSKYSMERDDFFLGRNGGRRLFTAAQIKRQSHEWNIKGT